MMLYSRPGTAAHILSFAQTLDGGGVERVLMRLARGWLAEGRRVTLVIGDDSGPLSAELPDGLRIRRCDTSDFIALARAVPGIIREVQPDVIFCPGNHYTSIAAWCRATLGRHCPPVVAKISNALGRVHPKFPMREAYRFWLKRHPGFVDQFVAMTPSMAIEAIQMIGVEPSRVSVIANPPATMIPGARMPALPDTRFILGIGRLAPQKRWERLIAAMPMLSDPAAQLVLFGEGSDRPMLERQVRELGLEGRVHLPGHVTDPLPALERAALVALVSDYEGVPNVLREALGHGTPVVATDSSVALREIVTDPRLGSIVPVGDDAALLNALEHWLQPGTARPAPVPLPGAEAAGDYLDLFDSMVAQRLPSAAVRIMR